MIVKILGKYDSLLKRRADVTEMARSARMAMLKISFMENWWILQLIIIENQNKHEHTNFITLKLEFWTLFLIPTVLY